MRPVTDLKRDAANAGVVELDRAGRCRVTIDGAGRPGNLTIGGQPGRFIEYSTDLDLANLGDYVMVTGNQRTPMRGAVLVRQITKRPLILLGPDGELMGVVGEHELYRGMLKQTDLGQSDSVAPITPDA